MWSRIYRCEWCVFEYFWCEDLDAFYWSLLCKWWDIHFFVTCVWVFVWIYYWTILWNNHLQMLGLVTSIGSVSVAEWCLWNDFRELQNLCIDRSLRRLVIIIERRLSRFFPARSLPLRHPPWLGEISHFLYSQTYESGPLKPLDRFQRERSSKLCRGAVAAIRWHHLVWIIHRQVKR